MSGPSRTTIPAVAGVLLLVAGCNASGSQPRESAGAAQQVPPGPSPEVAPSIFDSEGRLKGSGLKIDWLEIPAGFENAGSRPQHHLFVSHQVSVQQLRDYLEPRMLTGKVDELGEGAIYREVMPLSAAAGAMRFDVQVGRIDRGKGVSLTLEERTFLGAPPLSAAEAAKVLAEEQARAE